MAVANLLRLGQDVQAIGPPELRTALRKGVHWLQAVYGATSPRRTQT